MYAIERDTTEAPLRRRSAPPRLRVATNDPAIGTARPPAVSRTQVGAQSGVDRPGRASASAQSGAGRSSSRGGTHANSAAGVAMRVGYGRLAAPRPVMPLPRWKRTVRNVVIGLAVLVVLTIGFTRTVQGDTPGGGMRTVAVQPGQTVWSIAETYYTSEDPRDAVQQIEQTNHLSSSTLHPGDRLRVPRS